MSIWQDSSGNLHDDMGGAALELSNWPANQGVSLTKLTAAQAAAAQAPTLLQAQAAQITKLQAAYDAAVSAPVTFKNAAGVTSTYPAGNTLISNGMTAQQMLSTILAGGASAWTLGKWLDTDGVAQTFTFADVQGLAAAVEAVDAPDYMELVSLIAQVQDATTVAAVQAIVWPT